MYTLQSPKELQSEKASFDRLPKVYMTKRAMDHFDMRNEDKGAARLVIAQDRPLSKVKHEFASNGGPRLRWMQGASDLKGIPSAVRFDITVAPVSSGEGEMMVTRYGIADPVVFDANFELYLEQQGIFRDSTRFPDGKRIPKPRNLQEIDKSLSEKRNDEQPPGLDEEYFLCFVDTNMDPSNLSTMRTIIPTIAGPKTDQEAHGKSFDLEPIGDIAFVCPRPDMFDCARCRDLDESLCYELGRRIIPLGWYPLRRKGDPAVPNWFVEARIHSANTDACKRQICFASAYGARAMHTLQNYGRSPDDRVYDGNAYTYSAVYVVESRCLEMFAHHIAKAADGQEQYLMTKLCEFNMTESKESFQKGTNAFRNARDLARKYRDAVIKIANDRAAKQQSRFAAEELRIKARRWGKVKNENDNPHSSKAEPSSKAVPSSKAEPSSLPEAILQKGGQVLKRTRPDDAVEGDARGTFLQEKKVKYWRD